MEWLLPDCINALYVCLNFRFTSVVKGGFKYEGKGSVAIAGGDEIWLAINGTMLLEVISDPTDSDIKCKRIDLSNAAGTGNILLSVFVMFHSTYLYVHLY